MWLADRPKEEDAAAAAACCAVGRNRFLHLFFGRLHLCANYAPFCIYWTKYHTIAFINRVTSATLVLVGLTGLFTGMVRQWDHYHTLYEFGVERR